MRNVLGLVCVLLIAPVATAQTSGCTEDLNPAGPVVCVDDSMSPPKLSAAAKELRAHSFGVNGNVRVTWKTMQGGDLDIKFQRDVNTNEKCYRSEFPWSYCKKGSCAIKVNPNAAKGRGKGQCTYDLWVKGVLVDPVLIVEEWPLAPVAPPAQRSN